MTNILKKSFLLFLLLLTNTLAWGAEVEIGGINYQLDMERKEAIVLSRKPKYEGGISVPSTISHEGENFRVVKVESGAFYNCTGLTVVSLSEGITHLGHHAFAGCTGLTHVSLPESLREMGTHGFARCESLVSILLPKGLREMGSHSFVGCKALSSVTLPEGLDWLPHSTFEDCSALQSVSLPKGLLLMGRDAFKACTNLRQVALPEGLERIGERAFMGCESLRELCLPNSLEEVSAGVFKDCDNLRRLEVSSRLEWESQGNELPYGVRVVLRVVEGSVASATTAWRELVQEVSFEQGLSQIAAYTFAGCTQLREIELPEGLKHIGEKAFQGCTALEWISLPQSLQSLKGDLFKDCEQLQQILVNAERPLAISELGDASLYERMSLLVPQGSLEAYRSAPIWQKFKNISESYLAKVHQATANPQAECEAPIYTLQGQRLSSQQLLSLPAGLYIKEGRVMSLGQ